MTQDARRAIVAYETLFGATRTVAEAIADGLHDAGFAVDCRSIREVATSDLGAYDLIVVGAPTHARTMPTAASRIEGERWLEYRMWGRTLEPRATEPGLREWIAGARLVGRRVVAFTTRVDLPRLLSGSAVSRIERRIRERAGQVAASGLEARVDDRGTLLPGEIDRARHWGAFLVRLSGSVVRHG